MSYIKFDEELYQRAINRIFGTIAYALGPVLIALMTSNFVFVDDIAERIIVVWCFVTLIVALGCLIYFMWEDAWNAIRDFYQGY